MFKKHKIKLLQKQLNLKNEANTIRFLARLEGWIKAQGNTKKSLLYGISKIIKELHQDEIIQNTTINLKDIKNPVIKKYANEIIKLHKQGLGSRKIAQHLKEFHNAKISYMTIYKFLKAQDG